MSEESVRIKLNFYGKIISWNAGAEKMFGFCESEIAGTSFAKLHLENSGSDFKVEEFLKIAAVKNAVDYEYFCLRKDGVQFLAIFSVVALFDQKNILYAFVVSIKTQISDGLPVEIENEQKDDEYCKVEVDDLIAGKVSHSDLYFLIGSRKFIKIVKKGDAFPVDRIEQYKRNRLIHFYITKKDLACYLGMNLTLARSIERSTISKERKLQFLNHTLNEVLKSVHCIEVDEASFNHAKSGLENTLSLISEDNSVFNLLDMLNEHGDFLYAHSLGVSIYSAMLVKKMAWSSPQTQFKVSIAGLLHDIGKKEIDRSILSKMRTDMNAEEVKIYESHCMRGVEILRDITTLPSVVHQIVLTHHENSLGLGFPCGLKQDKVPPLAKAVAIADCFCNLSFKSPKSNGMNTKDALERVLMIYSNCLDPVMLRAFLKLFNVKISDHCLEELNGKAS